MEDALSSIGEWPKVLILRLHLVTAIDATGLNAVESVGARKGVAFATPPLQTDQLSDLSAASTALKSGSSLGEGVCSLY